eukprot:768452-Hanusia_phi.AAC.7
MNAERRGAIGCIIYSDPQDDGYQRGPTYPDGPWRPEQAVQRGSVQFNSLCAGDPARKYSKKSTMDLCGYATEDLIPSIPVLPISYQDAAPLLKNLVSPGDLPPGFQGGLPFQYATGPGPARVNLVVNNKFEARKIWNVFATIPSGNFGTEEDRFVLAGNHRDAWVYGAADPNSGTAALLEMARGLGNMLRKGWKPRRTVVLCNWDGEEYGLLGSTAWGEKRAKVLSSKSVVYLNVDVGVAGPHLSVHASPFLSPVITNVSRMFLDPGTGEPLDRAWGGAIGTLGSGSDYTVFLDHLGIPSVDLSWRHNTSAYGVYHSVYDSFSYMVQQVDPDFRYHALCTRFWGIALLRFADSPLLPYDPQSLGNSLNQYLIYVKSMMNATGCGGQCSGILKVLKQEENKQEKSGVFPVDLSELEEAVGEFTSSASAPALQEAMVSCMQDPGQGACSKMLLRRLNEALRRTERAFLDPQGLPGRKWFRHILQAPGLYLGYGADMFPGICQAIRDGDVKLAQAQVTRCAGIVRRAGSVLMSWQQDRRVVVT